MKFTWDVHLKVLSFIQETLLTCQYIMINVLSVFHNVEPATLPAPAPTQLLPLPTNLPRLPAVDKSNQANNTIQWHSRLSERLQQCWKKLTTPTTIMTCKQTRHHLYFYFLSFWDSQKKFWSSADQWFSQLWLKKKQNQKKKKLVY